jgi:hypothetical protein
MKNKEHEYGFGQVSSKWEQGLSRNPAPYSALFIRGKKHPKEKKRKRCP